MPDSPLIAKRYGTEVDAYHLWKQVKHILAGIICEHTESKNRPCVNCQQTIEPLAKPIARFAYWAAMGERPNTTIGKWDGYAALGAALDRFFLENRLDDPFCGVDDKEAKKRSLKEASRKKEALRGSHADCACAGRRDSQPARPASHPELRILAGSDPAGPGSLSPATSTTEGVQE